jgi:hypothetical protein
VVRGALVEVIAGPSIGQSMMAGGDVEGFLSWRQRHRRVQLMQDGAQ